MKRKIEPEIKKNKKPNISLRRKIRIYADRFILAFKLATVIFVFLLVFTKYLNPVKSWISAHFHEYTADMGLVLESVLIEGQKNVSSNDIVATLNADIGTPILSIPLDNVRASLSSKDWIKDAIVERRWPSTIYVRLVEREPIAIVQQSQKLYLVDSNGHIIKSNKIEDFAGLLHVVGSDANLHAANLQEELKYDPELAKKIISAVRYGERRWDLIFESGFTAKMPEQDFAKAFHYLSELNKNGKLFGQNYKTLDFRVQGKYYLEKYPEQKETQAEKTK